MTYTASEGVITAALTAEEITTPGPQPTTKKVEKEDGINEKASIIIVCVIVGLIVIFFVVVAAVFVSMTRTFLKFWLLRLHTCILKLDSFVLMTSRLNISIAYVSRVARKPGFGVFDQVRQTSHRRWLEAENFGFRK